MSDLDSRINRSAIDNDSSSCSGRGTSRPPRPTKKRTNVGTRRRSGSAGSYPDISYTVDGKLPSCTSSWNDISHLESVGIYYKESASTIPEILDMVFKETGMFAPLSPEKHQSLKKLQDQVTFSFSINELYSYETKEYLEEANNFLRGYKQRVKIQSVR